MDTGSYEFSSLKSKYEDFLNPSAEVSVNGSKIQDKYVVFDIDIENTINNDSVSYATLKIQNAENDFKKPDEFFLLKDFPLLKKIEIKAGYATKLKTIFTGYIFERTVAISGGGNPELTITCLCCKAFLRMNTEYKSHKDKSKLSEIVSAVLEKYSFSKEIEDGGALSKKMTIPQNGVTDFIYIRRIADELGYEFFAWEDKLYFRKPMSVSGDIIKLEPDDIFRIEHKSSMADIIAKTELYGYSQNTGKAETASANNVSKKIGSGKTGAQLMGSFPATETAYLYINDKSGLKLADVAKTHLQTKSMELVQLTTTTTGLPEIIPGRFMSVAKLGPDFNNTYYIRSVRHILRENYYITVMTSASNTTTN